MGNIEATAFSKEFFCADPRVAAPPHRQGNPKRAPLAREAHKPWPRQTPRRNVCTVKEETKYSMSLRYGKVGVFAEHKIFKDDHDYRTDIRAIEHESR